jgi:hypothetical protein
MNWLFSGSGGLGAVSSGLVEWGIEIVVILVVLLGAWKLVKLLVAALSH